MRASNNMNEGRGPLKADLDSMLTRVDSSLVTPQQKLRLYKFGVCRHGGY